MTLRSGRVHQDIESETPIVTVTATSSGAMEDVQRLSCSWQKIDSGRNGSLTNIRNGTKKSKCSKEKIASGTVRRPEHTSS